MLETRCAQSERLQLSKRIVRISEGGIAHPCVYAGPLIGFSGVKTSSSPRRGLKANHPDDSVVNNDQNTPSAGISDSFRARSVSRPRPQNGLVPMAGNLKPVEDQIDAVLCAFIAAHWWFWATERNRLYGTSGAGYIVVPERHTLARQSSK
jgi:hypothetical protein